MLAAQTSDRRLLKRDERLTPCHAPWLLNKDARLTPCHASWLLMRRTVTPQNLQTVLLNPHNYRGIITPRACGATPTGPAPFCPCCASSPSPSSSFCRAFGSETSHIASGRTCRCK